MNNGFIILIKIKRGKNGKASKALLIPKLKAHIKNNKSVLNNLVFTSFIKSSLFSSSFLKRLILSTEYVF